MAQTRLTQGDPSGGRGGPVRGAASDGDRVLVGGLPGDDEGGRGGRARGGHCFGGREDGRRGEVDRQYRLAALGSERSFRTTTTTPTPTAGGDDERYRRHPKRRLCFW